MVKDLPRGAIGERILLADIDRPSESENMPEDMRLAAEKQKQANFDNPFASAESRLAHAEKSVATAAQYLELTEQFLTQAKEELNKYQSEGSKYPPQNGHLSDADFLF